MKISANKPERLKISSKLGKGNQGKSKNNSTSKYVGVSLYSNKYISNITYNKKQIYLGIYNKEIDAAKAYDLKSIELFGNNAIINFENLRNDYISGKVLIIKNCTQDYSKSKELGIFFKKDKNTFNYRYFDKLVGKNKYKSFKTLEDAINFKREIIRSNDYKPFNTKI